MTDTAQPMLAAENVALDNAADAFKAFLNPEPAQPRDEVGRFASPQPAADQGDDLTDDEAVIGADKEGVELDDDQETDEAAEEAQLEAVDMPSSWGEGDAELWAQLSPEAQARIVEREAQRDAGLNQKLMEAANVRKALEAQAQEANANRDAYAQAIDQVVGMIQFPKPNPVDYGMGTEHYNRDGYDLAVYQWEQAQGQIQGLLQQRQQIAAQQEQEAQLARQAALQEIESVAWPRLVETVPELSDPAKGREIIADIVKFAVSEGLPEDAFRNGNVNSHEMRLLWMAKEYQRIKAAEKRVKAGNPPPKPAAPAVRPGGVTTRATVQASRLNKAQSRLAQEGSIEAGAAVFKQLIR